MVEAQPPPGTRPAVASGQASAFETIYRANFAVVTAFFARRTTDPQTVADLTSETFVQAITSFRTFDPARGTARGWLLGIGRHVFAQHCQRHSRGAEVTARLAGHRPIDVDEAAELVLRIDAERAGRVLLDGLASLSTVDREVIELVDIASLSPKEAAVALGVSSGALRIRLFRARARLRGLAETSRGES
ncbi:RNA polymerase sigma-70 factor (ECF subfamily) [Crossiella cryophila]|uniref:RNA polymerase sigma-70 factor (ECF subfamily) n=2 Tax=Crossiella cryophila TaxID=43355 RepID=A0A7W7FYD5_9PSEU|nr:RNA polymerase sigma-70 factor (ECF subfamily) [Crossiella cryophila]